MSWRKGTKGLALRSPPCASDCRWSARNASMRRAPSPARRGSLAGRRASRLGRVQILLSPSEAADGQPQDARRHDQARWVCEQAHQQLKEELGLDQLRGPLLARPPSSRADDNDRIRLPAKPPPRRSAAGEKATGPRTALLMPALQANPPDISNKICQSSGQPEGFFEVLKPTTAANQGRRWEMDRLGTTQLFVRIAENGQFLVRAARAGVGQPIASKPRAGAWLARNRRSARRGA